MIFTDKEITWACKMVLLDELNSSKTLRESLTLRETGDFRNFIKNLSFEECLLVLCEKPDINDEEYRGLKNLGWTDDDIEKMGTASAKAAFWNEIEPEAVLPKGFDPQILPSKQSKAGEEVINLEKNKKREYEMKQSLAKKYGLKKILIGVGIATLIAIIGYLLYRRYKDKCRQICFKSYNKALCMKKCKISNIKNVMQTLNSEKSKCGRNKKCVIKFDKKIKDWQEKLRSIR